MENKGKHIKSATSCESVTCSEENSSQNFADVIKNLKGKKVTVKKLIGTIENRYLHIKWHYNCYAFYSEYYFEAWVTKKPDPSSEKVTVESLVLRWRHGDTTGEEVGHNTAMVAKDDRVYSYDPACDTDICVIAIAYDKGGTWGASSPSGCAWKQ